MSDTSLHRVKAVYLAVVDLAPGERGGALDRACGGDAALRAKVARMLAADGAGGSFLAGPALVAGEDLLPGVVGALEAPERVGPYRVLGLLGEGGFGCVYRAEQAGPIRREVALKIIKPGMGTRGVIARFEAERQTLAMLDHPGIARVYDAGATDGGQPYFVMELIRGVPVTAYCDGARLTVGERVRLFIDICHAVQHAHQKGVIHRDIKPSNVMVQTAGGAPAVKVIDFGIAKAIDESEGGATLLTGVGQMVGTPDAMSPEQADASRGGVDTRTDIYALGALLYELLTGVTPLGIAASGRSSLAEITRAICEREPALPSARVVEEGSAGRASARGTDDRRLASQLRGDLDWIVMKALAKDRERRYETAGGLAEDLLRHLRNEPVSAGPPSRVYLARKFVRRHRVAVGASAVVLAAVGAGLVGTGVALSRALAAEAASREAREEAEAVNDFLVDDLLGSAHTEHEGPKVTVVEAVESGLDHIDARFGDRPAVAARIRGMIGSVYNALGMFDEAIPALEEAWRVQQRERGPDAAETLASQRLLAIALGQVGEDGRALELLRDGAARCRASLGADASLTLETEMMLGETLQRRGEYAEADRLLLRTIGRMREVMSEDDLPLLSALTSLGASLSAQGRLEEAEPICAEVLERSRARYRPGHPAVLSAMNNMSTLLLRLDKPELAEPICLELLGAAEEALPAGHWQIAWSRFSYGVCLKRLEKFGEAAPVLERAYREASAALGSTHAMTERALAELVGDLDTIGDPSVVDYSRLAAETRLRIANPEQRDSVSQSVREYIERFKRYRPDEDAATPTRLLGETARRMLDGGDADARTYLSNLGWGLLENGDYAEAERWLVSCRGLIAADGASDADAARVVEDRLAELRRRWDGSS